MSRERIYRVVVDRPGIEERDDSVWDGGPIRVTAEVAYPAWATRRYLSTHSARAAVARIKCAGGDAHIVTSDPLTWPEDGAR